MWPTNWIITWWVMGPPLSEGPLTLEAKANCPCCPPPPTPSCWWHWFLSTNTYRRDAIRQCFSSSDCCLPFFHWAASWQYTAQLNRVVFLYKRKKPSRADINVDCTPSNLVNCRPIERVINSNTKQIQSSKYESVYVWHHNIQHTTQLWQQMGCGMCMDTQYYMYSSTSGVKVPII